MVYDDIIIGSGLSALGTAFGLPRQHGVAVIAGPDEGAFRPYSSEHDVPCAYDGFGGLGNAWHGVIPLKLNGDFSGSDLTAFQNMFAFFYPETPIEAQFGKDWVFVPRRAIRPKEFWPKLSARFKESLTFVSHLAERVSFNKDGSLKVLCNDGSMLMAKRVWLCCGALGTPRLLHTSFGQGARTTLSDHVLIYLGRTDAHQGTPPLEVRTQKAREGFFLGVDYASEQDAMLTTRPARFDFAQLDNGFARRASFGLPMKRAIWQILKAPSSGLISEAFFNRYALFPKARYQSVYAQLRVPDALQLDPSQGAVQMRLEHIRAHIEKQRGQICPVGVEPSQRPELFLPLIHIHGCIEQEALNELGINRPGATIQINDAAGISDIGPEHHSFKMMLWAAKRAGITSAIGYEAF